MAMSRQDFIEAVWTELGATGPTDFARKLNLGPDGLQKVRRWRNGGRLDYEDVIVMLQKTGWWTPGLRPAGVPIDPLESIAADDVKILKMLERGLRTQEELRDEIQSIRADLGKRADASRTPTKRRSGGSR